MGGYSLFWGFPVKKVGFKKNVIAFLHKGFDSSNEVNRLPKAFKDLLVIIIFTLNN
jgi:hypothetical protein